MLSDCRLTNVKNCAPSGKLSPAAEGEQLFSELICSTCHDPGSSERGPVLTGLFGRTVTLTSGDTVVADEVYVRESILNPAARVVAGYQPLMPTYQGLVSEEQIIALIAYIESLQVSPSTLGRQEAE